MKDGVHELRYQFRIKDGSALWDVAAAKALSYPDATLDTVVETIGPRDDMDIVDCLLLLSQTTLSGCELVELSCDFLPD